MGTTYKITVTSTQIDSSKIHTSVDSILYFINQEMSTYIDGSTISRFNDLNPGFELLIGEDFYYVLQKSIYYNNISSGAFDITIKPLVELWGFGASGSILLIPDSSKVMNALTFLGLEKINISNNRVLTKNKEVSIDLSAIAKGFAVDKISNFLTNNSLGNHMVEIGGEVRVSGYNRSKDKWSIGIQNPHIENTAPLATLLISDKGIATSGNYRNYYDIDGKRYSHIISPATGYPVENQIRGITVISDNCLDSDALATALLVMDVGDGIKLIEDLKGFEVFYILDNGEHLLSSGFMNFVP
jgi:thiamine biosynthesis lipoprotein